MADTQISTTGGDVTERTSLRNGGVSAGTESLPVEDTAEQFSADEEEEVADDPLHYEDPLCTSRERDTGSWRVGSATIQ